MNAIVPAVDKKYFPVLRIPVDRVISFHLRIYNSMRYLFVWVTPAMINNTSGTRRQSIMKVSIFTMHHKA